MTLLTECIKVHCLSRLQYIDLPPTIQPVRKEEKAEVNSYIWCIVKLYVWVWPYYDMLYHDMVMCLYLDILHFSDTTYHCPNIVMATAYTNATDSYST